MGSIPNCVNILLVNSGFLYDHWSRVLFEADHDLFFTHIFFHEKYSVCPRFMDDLVAIFKGTEIALSMAYTTAHIHLLLVIVNPVD